MAIATPAAAQVPSDLMARAEKGNAEAQFQVAQLFHTGRAEIPRDEARAMEWYRRAAETGEWRAQRVVAEYDPVVGRRYAEAALKGKYEADKVWAHRVLCGVYLYGADVPVDAKAALPHCEAGADYARLGYMREKGLGVLVDLESARGYYAKASDSGAAQTGLGRLAGSDEEAVRFFRQGVFLGDPEAVWQLARSYEAGRGVVADPEEASRLYYLAADLRVREARDWIAVHPYAGAETVEKRQAASDAIDALSEITFEVKDATGTVSAVSLSHFYGMKLMDFYPSRAMALSIGGRVTMDCRVRTDGYFDNCVTVTEAPKGFGFAAAGSKAMTFRPRLAPEKVPLLSQLGGRYRLGFNWVLE